ncbi:histone-like nucleoid-structuring protein Lsr2 [Auraticoccus monumenti]|uniref:Lsr2 protein n=1 Tax=Auraticoccus monumenti TaxID=675864 RepID=A0A1G7D2U1_9ACTN|nr:Lsr2 family protein [Auraticoccus monumenti]SDE45821.1 Lsr2 protein [Auraticoccus monumenti]
MGKRTIELLVDDIDGTELNENDGKTIRFAWQGVEYSIDLSEKNAKKFEDAVEPYRTNATRVGGRVSRGAGVATRTDRSQLAAIRKWARAKGMKVSERGRISQEVLDAYNDEN